MRVGSDLLVSGSLSPSLVRDDVIKELAVCQNNLTAHLRRLIGDKIADAKKQRLTTIAFPSGPESNHSENALFQLEQKDGLVPGEHLEKWATVFEMQPNPRIDDLAARPKVLVTAKNPTDLKQQLQGLHNQRPLVVLGLHRASEVRQLAETCDALLDGLYPTDISGETCTGHLLVTDPLGVLHQVAQNADDQTAWPGRLVWLVDGGLGPDVGTLTTHRSEHSDSSPSGRFSEALVAGLAKRFNNHDASSTVYPFDLGRTQIQWVSFLQSMEHSLPGITVTARPLLATLAFGLIELANAPKCRRLDVSPAEALALAKWIIQRMANTRSEMVNRAERERLLRYAKRVVLKLMEGPMDRRDLYRALSLPAALFDEIIFELKSIGVVRCDGGILSNVSGEPLCEAEAQILFLS